MNKTNYPTLTDSDLVKLQDIYNIVYFIKPKGIRTLSILQIHTHNYKSYLMKTYKIKELGTYKT